MKILGSTAARVPASNTVAILAAKSAYDAAVRRAQEAPTVKERQAAIVDLNVAKQRLAQLGAGP
jgi:hypothetical protein